MDKSARQGAEKNAPSPPRSVRAVSWLLSFAALVLLMSVIWISRMLRPMADDYSAGVSARDGLVAGVLSWWQTWSGDLANLFIHTSLVGLPLIHLPWSLASALPFLAAVVTVVGLAMWLMLRVRVSQSQRRPRLLIVLQMVPVLAIAWWGFWWVSVLQSRETLNAYPLAQGVTFWQTLNSMYVVAPTLLIWGWLILESRDPTSRLWPLYLAAGLLAGFNGPVFAGSALVMIVLLAGSSVLQSGKAIRERGVYWLLASVGIIGGAVASHFSPGSQYRKTFLANPEMNSELVFRMTTEGVPGGVNDWWSGVTSPGALVAVILMAGLGTLLSRQGWRPDTAYLLTVATALITFSLVFSLVNRASEYFAYPAYWHLVQPRTVTWLGLMALAATLGALLGRLEGQSLVVPVAALAATVALALSAASLAVMASEVINRGQQWEVGPAPLAHVSDIENPEGWQRNAWNQLRELREDAPLRGLD